MRSATCLSRSLSETVDGTDVPTEARTRVDTTEDSVDLDISSETLVDVGVERCVCSRLLSLALALARRVTDNMCPKSTLFRRPPNDQNNRQGLSWK